MAEGSRITLPLRLWFIVEILFGVFAILGIALAPAATATTFAWDIQPPVSAAVLGGFYLSVAPVFVLAALARRWEMVRVIIWPAIVFTSMELLATFLHWENFLHGTTGFYTWFASYALPPPVFLALYIYQQRRAGTPITMAPLGRGLRITLIVLGSLLVVEGLLSFVSPTLLTANHAIGLTPLTARALAGWLTALGLLMLSIARENGREASLVATPFLILPLPMLTMQILRFPDQVDWSHPRLLFAGALFATVAGLGVALTRGDWRKVLTGRS